MADARLAMMAVLDTVAATPRFSVAWGEEALLTPLMHDYAAEVPFYSALPMMEIDVPFTVDMIYALQGAGARETWLDSRITREWVVPNNLDDFFWLVLMRQPTRTGTFVIITDRDRHQITRAELDAVSLLSPHVRRAVTIGDMFEEERRTAGLFRAVVDALSHPVLIVDRAMRILFANPAAEQMLADRGTVSSTHGQLSFSYAEADAAVSRAVALGEHNEFALGAAGINVPLLRARAPAVAHVMPLARRDIRARITNQAAAAIFIAEAGCGPIPALDALAALFGLTAAERRVAGHVAMGRSRAEIAQASGVSDGTVKSQLAAIFDKTGTGDQRELQGLFRELSPPVRQSPTS
ncbi:helix-turn-helix transcriptional regulator [Nitratireductor mangrovi]|uniref:Helix-turn-helix transcriptional regulator n=1 Tax=Nitratireductor mangrovi TaxID=2599600 RepID=A0A5B8L4F8_9HYPH|nr:helix-turn-helix transcriptional regulator [Nitratireductor mangrovi]QDZ02817.2 helix-turn-helix transcriptional regulator [Nitratireductor mangrovi]